LKNGINCTDSGTKPGKRLWVRREEERKNTYLGATRSHAKLSSQVIAKGRVGFCVDTEDGLENLELGRGGAAPVLDLVGGVGVESTEVDGGRVVEREGTMRVMFILHGGCGNAVVAGIK